MFSNIEIDYKKVNNTTIFFMRQRWKAYCKNEENR